MVTGDSIRCSDLTASKDDLADLRPVTAPARLHFEGIHTSVDMAENLGNAVRAEMDALNRLTEHIDEKLTAMGVGSGGRASGGGSNVEDDQARGEEDLEGTIRE
ncbi:hypothetical protein Ct61P_05360 [Colletotrichum tofieldiae]|uniref:Uncharacterized protein n=1 Tax=Colletotrichum liriopes TaxID=708192 RepID=A0AA37GMH6_9PEZI|nr:hypothetical protein ColLi_06305 [Colletotrichum liriopes]GKT87510.1 hypothetical protein Ct61P_05360 [Colletotrichum tofieldiae]